MKNGSYVLLIAIQFFASRMTGQTLFTNTDSIPLSKDTIIWLRVPNHRGNLQWQKTADGINWTGIPGKTADSLQVKKDAEISYRAMITEGTCEPVFSDIARIVFIKPEVSTDSVINITQITALSGGRVVSDGGMAVTGRGLCWNTTGNPTIAGSKTSNGTGTGSYISSITGLKANTRYYIRAYGTNAKGTNYGSQRSFTTSASGEPTGTFTDSRDGKTYKWVQIGTQVWMVENLAWLPSVNLSSYHSNGTPCYYVLGYNGSDVNAAKATANYATYGVLYNWTAAAAGATGSYTNPSGVKGACPEGWHLPSDAEWTHLFDYLISNGYGYQGSGEDIAKSLASKTNWVTDTTSGAPGKESINNNITGFSGLPGGVLQYSFSLPGYLGVWWSSSAIQDFGWYRDLTYLFPGFPRYLSEKFYGCSVRCVRDIGTNPSNEAPNLPSNQSPVNNASVIPLKPVLVWDASDPDGDTLKYDVYLGTSAGSVSPVSTDLPGKSYTPSANLTPGTDYYWKIVVKDSKGLSTEGPVLKFTTSSGSLNGTFTDNRDGKTYKWIQIGNQGWMAENLAWLPVVSPSTVYSSVNKHYYVYEYEGTNVATAKTKANYATCGALYNWPAAMEGAVTSNLCPSGVRGACPAGWHLPGEREWNTLRDFLINNGYGYQGSGDDVAKSLAEKTSWRSALESGVPGNDPESNNTTGFSGLAGGQASNGYFDEMTFHGLWWSSAETDQNNGWVSVLGWDQPTLIIRGSGEKDMGHSIRCIRD